ncbi:MAG: winged helix-turn-helix domain-containing protein [Promethearchaeota archaeon]
MDESQKAPKKEMNHEKKINLIFKCKIWITDEKGTYIFGEGNARLLKAIEETKDLSKAGKIIGLSYRKAWNLINNVKKKKGIVLTETNRGGKGGGGNTYLTETGKKILELFTEFQNKAIKLCEEASTTIEFD